MIDVLTDAMRRGGVQAINRTRRRIDQMFDIAMATSLQDIEKTHHIGFDINQRIFQTVTHACLACEIDDVSKMLCAEEVCYSRFVLKVHANKFESAFPL